MLPKSRNGYDEGQVRAKPVISVIPAQCKTSLILSRLHDRPCFSCRITLPYFDYLYPTSGCPNNGCEVTCPVTNSLFDHLALMHKLNIGQSVLSGSA